MYEQGLLYAGATLAARVNDLGHELWITNAKGLHGEPIIAQYFAGLQEWLLLEIGPGFPDPFPYGLDVSPP